MADFLLGDKMIKLYMFILIGALCTVFYFYGLNVGKSKCEIKNYTEQINISNQNDKQKRILNDTVYKTGVRDIRRILHDKYTIGE